ncbi:hypothetical protein [Agromyces albus]|uniref:hypothetical protein n=1 Tax=Agromyces albus TaxID=205332 RepID=UPI0027D7FC69|nr:hypothetical protein [Agromyces albus]
MPRPLDFDRDVWPVIVRDGYDAYYRTLAEVRPEALPHGLEPITSAIDEWDGAPGALDAAIAPFVTATDDRFELADLIHPAAAAGPFAHPAAFDAWVHDYLERDLDEADAGTRSPLKAGLWSIGAARKAVAELIAFDGVLAESFRGGYRDFVSFGGMIGSGPPAFRTRQLLALADAGLVHFIGPGARLRFDESERPFVADSPIVADSAVAASVLIDAWMHLPDLGRAADEVVVGLREQGRMRPHVRHASDGTPHPTAAIDVDPETSRLIAADGSIDPAVIVIGIPLDESRGDTIISPMPGANSTMLRETDRAVAAAYETLTEARRRAAA